MKLLITAFEPFGGESVNPSMTLLSQLPDQILDHELMKCVLPVTFTDSKTVLESFILENKPDLILCLGQAGGRTALSIEQIAINLNEAAIPDNAGNQPKSLPIDPEGPDGLFATLPLKALLNASKAVGVPTIISYTAGTYVCNHVMYSVLNLIRRHQLTAKAGFVHIPFETSQVMDKPAQPAMSAEYMLKGILAMLEELVAPKQSLKNHPDASGATH